MPTKQEIATNPTTANDNEITALLRAFEFEGGDIRILDSNGDPWFVLADVCRVLGIDPADPVRRNRLDDDELRSVDMSFHMVNIQGAIINGLGLGAGNNITNLVSESGMYRLVLTSRKPEAKRFRKWVTGTVLPSIRKHGGYIAGQETKSNAEILADGLRAAESIILEREARISTLEADYRKLKLEAIVELAGAGTMVAALERHKDELLTKIREMRLQIASAARASSSEVSKLRLTVAALRKLMGDPNDHYCLRDVAKMFGFKADALAPWLNDRKWIYHGNPGWHVFQDKIDDGLMVQRFGGDGKRGQPMVTTLGIEAISVIVEAEGLHARKAR
jgi:prophage antirepressor-like protein